MYEWEVRGLSSTSILVANTMQENGQTSSLYLVPHHVFLSQLPFVFTEFSAMKELKWIWYVGFE